MPRLEKLEQEDPFQQAQVAADGRTAETKR